jgi:hypothetical protein
MGLMGLREVGDITAGLLADAEAAGPEPGRRLDAASVELQ